MNLLATDVGPASLYSRLSWDHSPPASVSGDDTWSRASRRMIAEVRDEQGHHFPIRNDLWVTVYPPRGDGLWRVEADAIGPALVGRGRTAEEAISDWRKRFRTTTQRFLEMRPFETTQEDRNLWSRIQIVIDVPHYKASKPLVIRQVGKVVKQRTGMTVVEWEDGAREKVRPEVFDDAFARFRVGQPFEAVVTRHANTFRIIRAAAVRRLPSRVISDEQSDALWNRVVGPKEAAKDPAIELDEGFWLKPPE